MSATTADETLELAKFRTNPDLAQPGTARGSAIFFVGDDTVAVLWTIGKAGFGAWKEGSGLREDDPLWIATKARACAELELSPEAIGTMRTACEARPFTDPGGVVHVPHYIATAGDEEPGPVANDAQAKDAYLSYCEARGWTLPRWEELCASEQEAWAHVARQIRAGQCLAQAGAKDEAGAEG